MSYFSGENNEDKDELRHEIRREIKREARRKKMSRCFGCCAAIILVILVLASLVSFVLAKTGLVNIPVFTKLFYNTPKPGRAVEVKTSGVPVMESLNQQLAKQLGSAGKNNKPIFLDLKISEEELSAMLKSAAGQAGQNASAPDFQVAIMPDKLEFFGQIPQISNSFLTLGIMPKVVGGQLALDLVSVKVGNLALPASAANLLVQDFMSQQLKKINEFLSSQGELESINLYDGYMEIKGRSK